jgi:hypothetical protein
MENKGIFSIILAYLQKLVLNKSDFPLQGLLDYLGIQPAMETWIQPQTPHNAVGQNANSNNKLGMSIYIEKCI